MKIPLKFTGPRSNVAGSVGLFLTETNMRIFRVVLFLGAIWCVWAAATRAQTIGCSSDDGHRRYCRADTRNGVTLSNQTSSAACQQGYSWGYDEGGIWVDHGCRAYFTLQAPSGRELYCASDDGHKHYCEVDTRGSVALVRQRSGAACQQDYSWGYDGRGIWVDHGCRADFAVQVGPAGGDWGGHAVVRCSSDDGGRHYCPADTGGDVELLKQHSHADCIRGSTWGFDPNGIWVDRGCRAEFVVEPNERPEYTGREEEEREHHGRACRRAIGEDRAHELVEQCRQVSPGTHPPCNADNSCRVITEEIRRSCMLLGADAPRLCDEYR